MAKKSKEKTTAPKPIQEKVPENYLTKPSTSISLGWNVGLLLFTLILLVVLYNNNDSYQWLYKQMLKGNLDFIKTNSNLSYTDKIESKFGLDYTVAKTINANTPEDAIILFPSGKIIDTVRKANKLPNRNETLISKDWNEYFIFPRKVLYAEAKDSTKLKPTHVLILGGLGYENLPYTVENEKHKFLDVLPIRK